MQIVIDIPEERFKDIQRIASVQIDSNHFKTSEQIIANGTPLPKGHGRLIDADSMKTMKNIQSANFNAVELIRLWIDNQLTIIEADKVESEDKDADNN